MSVIIVIVVVIVLIVVLIDIILWSAWRPKAQKTAKLSGDLPFVSILLAVRNEVHTVNETLESLEALDYPKDKYEILMGDDGSDDGTDQILKTWERENKLFKYFLVEDESNGQHAKANVLAKLDKHANGDMLMITDADITVPRSWIRKHLACFKPDMGIQSGFTVIQANSFFSSMQMIDWSLALGMIKIVSGWNYPVTAVGNNMMVSKEAYTSVGGYENIPFSITEDYALFKAIVKNDFKFQQLANAESMAKSKAEKTFIDLLQQRKRWMRGAMKLPFFMKMILFFQAAYYPAILFLLIVNPLVGIPLFGLKTTLQSLFITKIHERLGEYMPLGHLFIFEIYSALFSIVLIFYYLIPLPVLWKGRKY